MSEVPRGLLRETLRDRLTPDPAAGCVDSETLAAWSEGTLTADEREAVEGHAADCARCQSLLAAMARTAPQPSPAKWWRPSTFGWLAPLAAAAAAVLLWINLAGPSLDRPVDRLSRPPSAPAASRDVAPLPAAPSPEAPSATPRDRRADESKNHGRARAGVPATAPRTLTAAADQPDTAVAQKKAAAQPAESPVAGKAALSEPGDAVTTKSGDATTTKGAPPAAGAVGALPRAEPTVTVTAESPLAQKFDAVAAQRMAKVAASPVLIASPDPNIRWRIVPGGEVARTIDGGGTWQAQSTGASVALTAGAAPAPTVCWLVGPGGTIVVSTDGRTWQRVTFPEMLDLIAVRAVDASSATVTGADGRTFSTIDGGKSWRQP